MTAHRPLDKGNLSEQVYSIIRTALMDGQYQPGDRLRISTLAEGFGVSITPVREAIFRLVSEQALDMKAATSIFVPHLTVVQLREVLLIRQLLEGEAAAIAARRINAPELEQLEAMHAAFQAAATLDASQAALLNREFHFGVMSAAHMPVLTKTLENMWVIMGPLLARFQACAPAQAWAHARHLQHDLLDGVRNGDPAKAKAALQLSVARGEQMIDWLSKAQALPA